MLAAMRISIIKDINPSTTKTESVKHKKQMQKKKKKIQPECQWAEIVLLIFTSERRGKKWVLR